jgi:(1->4)-alpha-D-glucan 1-alpha-D-glucosylmutase
MQIVSTYRLQFHKAFTFRDATAIVRYLHDLGITHVYASPYLKAVAGSTHGYDVIDHDQLNPEIGSEADFRHFVATLKQHGMSHILDTVPNHMGVETNDNHWWNDVLAHGNQSAFANYFDIDREGFAPRKELADKVMMPVLGETLAEAIDKGLLQLKWIDGKPFIEYHARRFPIDPNTDTSKPLPELLARQHYRLCYWRMSADEINYRRFFDITGLAALQMQRQEVFDVAHQFTFRLIADGSVAGLRVDHPDGLLDPEAYFDRLQAKFKVELPTQDRLPVWVEKILNGDEQLCQTWNVSGTSGYDFLCAINNLYVDPSNEAAMTDAYVSFTGSRVDYAHAVYLAKKMVLDTAMHSEMESLTNRLDALAQMQLSSQDFTRRILYDALREVIACFPLYRSYVSARGVSEADIAVVTTAVDQARVRNPKIDPAAFSFIRDSVLLRYPVAESARPGQLAFAQRFQQLTSPVNAKGIEDCTFYNYNRLTSLNEVGGDPGRFGRESGAIHKYLFDRQARWPLALSSLSTHDTKRSEDVRARLNVLSEIPEEWSERLQRWKQMNAVVCGTVHPNDQCLLYQSLLGAWPMEPMDDAIRKPFIERISAYMVKATREAKQRTSWLDPDTEYESAITCLIAKLVDPETGGEFLADFLPFQQWISQRGMINSLSQTVLRLTAPGICDTYQGTELWDLSLVDPDNRRPVDYEHRKELLSNLNPSQPTENMQDGRIKLWVTTRLLQHRRSLPDLFLGGSYEIVQPTGEFASRIFCFARAFEEKCAIVIVPRLVATLQRNDRWGDVDWGSTQIDLPASIAATSFENLLTGERIPVADRKLSISQILGNFPVAVLV